MIKDKGNVSLIVLVVIVALLLAAGAIVYQKKLFSPSTTSQYQGGGPLGGFGIFGSSTDTSDQQIARDVQAADDQLKGLDAESLDIDQSLSE